MTDIPGRIAGIVEERRLSGVIILIIAIGGLLLGFGSLAIVATLAPQIRDLNTSLAAAYAKIDTLEKGQAGLDSFITESRIHWIDAEKQQDYQADAVELVASALHLKLVVRPKRTLTPPP